MNKALAAAVISALFFIPVMGFSAEGVTWHSFNKGLALAKSQNKPILLDFYASWCGWCRVMDRNTFQDEGVTAELKRNFVSIRINTDSRERAILFRGKRYTAGEFSSLLGVRGLPTVVFMDKKGDFIARIPGFLKKDIFFPLLQYIQSECYRNKVPFERYVNDRGLCSRQGT